MSTFISSKSTVVNKIHYSRRVMKVKFASGRTYSFRGVPRAIFESFKKATSLGKFFNQEVKGKFLTIEV